MPLFNKGELEDVLNFCFKKQKNKKGKNEEKKLGSPISSKGRAMNEVWVQ